MKDISCEEMISILENQNTAFLCGNGFSINFDKDFGNIYDRLYDAHKAVIRNGQFNVKANRNFNKVYKDNYNSVIKYLRFFDEKRISDIFIDGVIFAQSILDDTDIIFNLKQEKLIKELTFGVSELSLVENIAKVGKNKGYKYVNIEYWSILIYMYFAIMHVDKNYAFPINNEFITLIKLGNVNKNKIVQDADIIQQYCLSNGFNTYYRMLFCTAILADGKAVYFSNLENIKKLDLGSIKDFLNKFKALITLNYDHVLEDLTGRNVRHIHGEYILNKQEYVYFQSLGIELENHVYVSFSDILIGDYFINKAFAEIVNAMNKSPINKRVTSLTRSTGTTMEQNDIETVLIFGMNINNDQHIIRDIMLNLSDRQSDNVKIIYCYFCDEDRKVFEEQYNASITFRSDVSENVRNIEVLYIKTQDILNDFFLSHNS